MNRRNTRTSELRIVMMIAIGIIPLFLFLSCKEQHKDPESGVDTIDNIANADPDKFQLNNCERDDKKDVFKDKDGLEVKVHTDSYEEREKLIEEWLNKPSNFDVVSGGAETFEKARPVLKQVMMAAPIYAVLLHINRGTITELSDGYAPTCKKIWDAQEKASDESKQFLELGVTQPFGCWHFDQDEKSGRIALGTGKIGDKRTVTLEQAIGHAFLRNLVYMFKVQLDYTTAANETQAKELAKQRKLIAEKGETLRTKLFEDLAEDKDNLTRLKKIKKEDLIEVLFVESIDSIYCSDKARTAYREKFPKTFEAATGGKDTSDTE